MSGHLKNLLAGREEDKVDVTLDQVHSEVLAKVIECAWGGGRLAGAGRAGACGGGARSATAPRAGRALRARRAAAPARPRPPARARPRPPAPARALTRPAPRAVLKHHEKLPLPEIEKPLKTDKIAEVVPAWDAAFVDIEKEFVYELILAANFLDIPSLLSLACCKVACLLRTHITGKAPHDAAAAIRAEFNIANDLTAEEEAKIKDGEGAGRGVVAREGARARARAERRGAARRADAAAPLFPTQRTRGATTRDARAREGRRGRSPAAAPRARGESSPPTPRACGPPRRRARRARPRGGPHREASGRPPTPSERRLRPKK